MEYHSVCTADREFFGTCNLMYYPTNLDRDYQYFDSPRLGGNFNATDFCPISVPDSPLISCTDPNSRCFEAKNRYTFGTNTYVHTKLGCYQVITHSRMTYNNITTRSTNKSKIIVIFIHRNVSMQH